MTNEEIRAFKPIINSMKLIRELCENLGPCKDCIFSPDGDRCFFGVPLRWDCENAIAALEAEEAEDE